MTPNSRFLVSLFFLLIIPFGVMAEDSQVVEENGQHLISDSLVVESLRYIDSILAIHTIESSKIAETLLNDLLSKPISNKNLAYQAISQKLVLLQNLSRHTDAIDFLNKLILEGYRDPEIYADLANEYHFNNEYSKSISSSQEAILSFQKKGNLQGVADATNYLIVTYGELGMFDEAREYFNKNLKLCNKIGYNIGLIRAYQEYGESYVFNNPDLSFELLKKGKEIAKSISEAKSCQISIYLIRYYINTNKISSAKSAVKEFLLKCTEGKIRVSNVYTLMAHIYSLENNIDSTIFYNNLALDLRKQSGNGKMIANSYLNLSGNYLAKNEVIKANQYLDKAESIVLRIKDPNMLLTYYKGRERYYEFIKDYKTAYLFSQKEIEQSKIMTNKRHHSVLAKLNTSFEIQQKNVLLERELENRKAKIRLFIFILILVLLLSSGAYLIYLYRKNKFSYLKLVNKTINIEEKLSISDKERHKFQAVFEYSVTGILVLDKNGTIQYANRKSKELLDSRDESQFLCIPFADFFEGENKISVEEALLNVFMENKAVNGFKVQLINKKSLHWLDISCAPLVFKEDDDNVLVTLIDVTQEVINIGREQEQKQELQTLINSVTESILFIQRNGKIKALNKTAESRLGLRNKDLIGASYFDIIPKAVRKKRIRMFDKVVLEKKPLIELEMIGNNNNLVSMYPNINPAGNVDYVSEFVQDITERRIAEERIDNLKQRVLRSQMNPHFIFNSLTSIQSFVIRNDAAMASQYLNSFARLIRLILESSRHDYISLKSEIDILNYYLEIQKMRFSDNFVFSFEIDPALDIERIKIPPMLAQPFIENSIEHGIQHLEKKGELNIKFVKEENHLMIELRDNGIGREASSKMNKGNIFASKSLSTEIVNDRLLALNKYSKDIISYNIIDLKGEKNEAIGTQVIISIPIDYF